MLSRLVSELLSSSPSHSCLFQARGYVKGNRIPRLSRTHIHTRCHAVSQPFALAHAQQFVGFSRLSKRLGTQKSAKDVCAGGWDYCSHSRSCLLPFFMILYRFLLCWLVLMAFLYSLCCVLPLWSLFSLLLYHFGHKGEDLYP